MEEKSHQCRFRLPADLKQRLESEAKAAMRSMNSELTVRLRERYRDLDQQQEKAA